jgi:hypothetical protein
MKPLVTARPAAIIVFVLLVGMSVAGCNQVPARAEPAGSTATYVQKSASGCTRERWHEMWTPWDCSGSTLPACVGPAFGEREYPNGCVVSGSRSKVPEVYPGGSMYRDGLFYSR